MKNLTIAFVVTLSTLVCNFISAQGFQGQATYMSKRTMKNTSFESSGNGGISTEMQKQIQEQLSKAMERTYILDFTATESNYRLQQELEAPKAQSNGMSISFKMSGDDTVLYKNSKSKIYKQEEEFYNGKTMLITDSLPKYEWKIQTDVKKIGGYDCYKAIAIIKVSPKQIAAYEALKLKQSKQKKKPLFPAEMPKDIEIVAWFTNAIPVSHGPGKFWGLPGLIIELVEEETTYLCSKIVLNPKEKKAIEVPNKGKVISQEAFDEAEKKYYDKMADEDGVIIHTTTGKGE
jgi:GLPGLI family protein